MNRTFVSLGSGLAFLAVALGAFGTHSLRDRLSPNSIQIWQTGVQYHLIHAVALVLVGIIAGQNDSRAIRASGWLLTIGILVFSGSLYALAVTGIRILGAITPIGGICFLTGWGILSVTAAKGTKSQ